MNEYSPEELLFALEGDDEILDMLYAEYGDKEDERAIGCLFPNTCCMPGFHFPSECHTAEMMEQQATDENRQTEAT